jgi:hypothetical protein
MSIDAMKQALEALEDVPYMSNKDDYERFEKAQAALRHAIEQAERQEPVVNIELSRRMAAVKVSNFYGSIIKDAEKEIERLHGLVEAAAAAEREACIDDCNAEARDDGTAQRVVERIRARGEKE